MLRPLFTLFLTTQVCSAVLITGASVIDGTGTPASPTSVRVINGRISAIGALKPLKGEPVIDASGLTLAPGFIDTHNHSGSGLEHEPGAATQVSQGITTVLLGQDGGSPWPIGIWLNQRVHAPSALNVMTLAGHATIRQRVMGTDYRRPASPKEEQAMAALAEDAMRQGAFGLSSGLEYEVGRYSSTTELIAMCKAVSSRHGIYVSHVRDESDAVLDSIREIIQIAREANLPVQISHIKMGTRAVWNRAGEAVALVDEARRKGQDVTADCYPYDAWHSTISVLVPGGNHRDAEAVRKVLDDAGGPERITIAVCKAHPEYEFHNLRDIAAQQKIAPELLVSRIISEGGASVVGQTMVEADIRTFYRQPWVMVGSDGGIGMRHPRSAGTYPKVLGKYVREQGWLSLEEAIRKMTSLPADRLGLHNRGRIAPGNWADLVLFDPKVVIDRATFAEPALLSSGIEKVWVNGQLVWSGGRVTGLHPGQVLRHQN